MGDCSLWEGHSDTYNSHKTDGRPWRGKSTRPSHARCKPRSWLCAPNWLRTSDILASSLGDYDRDKQKSCSVEPYIGWVTGELKLAKGGNISKDLRMDVRVSWLGPAVESWEPCEGHASQEKMESYPLYNRVRARHALQSKTNLAVPIPASTTKWNWELSQRSTASRLMPWNPLPVGWTLTPYHQTHKHANFFSTEGSTTTGSLPRG